MITSSACISIVLMLLDLRTYRTIRCFSSDTPHAGKTFTNINKSFVIVANVIKVIYFWGMEDTLQQKLDDAKQNAKQSYRSQALQMAERLNSNTDLLTPEALLADADKLYEWLIKDL